MLILTRRVGESIVVGDDVTVTVFEVRGDSVRIGIDAPKSVQVHRQEVYLELQRANQAAASPSDDAVDALRGALRPADAPRDATVDAGVDAAVDSAPGSAVEPPADGSASGPQAR